MIRISKDLKESIYLNIKIFLYGCPVSLIIIFVLKHSFLFNESFDILKSMNETIFAMLMMSGGLTLLTYLTDKFIPQYNYSKRYELTIEAIPQKPINKSSNFDIVELSMKKYTPDANLSLEEQAYDQALSPLINRYYTSPIFPYKKLQEFPLGLQYIAPDFYQDPDFACQRLPEWQYTVYLELKDRPYCLTLIFWDYEVLSGNDLNSFIKENVNWNYAKKITR